jgi:2-(1,2-epoxy-1,2-dihydrophenyl)acetyl-CoA isomerase
MALETIQFEVQEGVGTLTLNRPTRKNAIDPVMREELKEVVFSLPQQRDLRALIITGAGGTFCAGGDISVMGAGSVCLLCD